ncbi:MerR family transcriptional regulator [Pectinatus frisingensis]|jgi:DNA-binding transcriptional MerR regulator|uniref:MerR family transcriptional regulator n=1 Tax=Pectinatus frisingensis TaxID=865 RepID=UPI0015F3E54D|nr:MerR family transcriptional regulator [Pectinatus frisingensis]
MYFKIGEAARRTGLSIYTIRYYDKEKLLSFLKRDKNGQRIFDEDGLLYLGMICCLKDTGMPIKDIRHFIEWSMAGETTIDKRECLLREHKQKILEKIVKMNGQLLQVENKLKMYARQKKSINDD